MLYFILLNESKPVHDYDRQKEITWHVGGGIPKLDGLACKLVQADGDELQYIENHFPNIRKAPYTRVVKWRGDDAQFIWDNFPAK